MITPPQSTASDERETNIARLTRLADSINETARMARATVLLLLLVALYLAVTVLSALDEKLFYDHEVGMPQIGVSVSIILGYIFAAPLFLYLHIQTLFLLRILARKMQCFQDTLDTAFPRINTASNNTKHSREEFWNLLSAFSFVQLYRKDVHTTSMARFLIWLSMTAVPLTLLLAIDLSFVRYQSAEITWSHHINFGLDLIFIILFKRAVFHITYTPSSHETHQSSNISQSPLLQKVVCQIISHIVGDSTMTRRRRATRCVGSVFVISSLLILFLLAQPPNITFERDKAWQSQYFDSLQLLDTQLSIWEQIRSGKNWIDVIPCQVLDMACRYLTIRRGPSIGSIELSTPDYVREIVISGRNLRFADFRGASIANLSLTDVDLRLAKFVGARLTNLSLSSVNAALVDFSGVTFEKLNISGSNEFLGAKFRNANVSGAQLRNVVLNSVDFTLADLSNADLYLAEMRNSTFSGADLQNARLESSILRDANFGPVYHAQYLSARTDFLQRRTILDGANLMNSDLENAILWTASLRRADLQGAILRNANLQLANLENANLGKANLEGADLRSADLDNANLAGALLTDANIAGAHMASVRGLLQKQLEEACISKGDDAPSLPESLATLEWSSRLCLSGSH